MTIKLIVDWFTLLNERLQSSGPVNATQTMMDVVQRLSSDSRGSLIRPQDVVRLREYMAMLIQKRVEISEKTADNQ